MNDNLIKKDLYYFNMVGLIWQMNKSRNCSIFNMNAHMRFGFTENPSMIKIIMIYRK